MYLVYCNKTNKLIDRVVSSIDLLKYKPKDVTVHIVHI
jgi:hypothetical protein